MYALHINIYIYIHMCVDVYPVYVFNRELWFCGGPSALASEGPEATTFSDRGRCKERLGEVTRRFPRHSPKGPKDPTMEYVGLLY